MSEGNVMLLCPACMVELRITERQDIEIDYCPQCRGIWLDRGELDKIIDRSRAASSSRQRYEEEPLPRSDYRRRKRKSFLEELFDFD